MKPQVKVGQKPANELTPKMRIVASLLATGLSGRQACNEAELDPSTLSQWRKLPAFQAYMNDLTMELEREGFEQLQALQARAIEKLGSLLESPNDGVALKAAEAILNRVASL
jgi:transposase-like protein